jgi:hypothetical protein
MDDRRFDALARGLAAGRDRRSLLTTLLGLGAVAVTGAAFGPDDARAARRTTPNPTIPACPGSQHWDGNACVCSSGHTICGPACCPNDESVCCDGACCHGDCFGEELCCPTGSLVCHGAACCTPAEVCLDDRSCCTPKTCATEPPDSLFDCGSSSDGCGGNVDCICPENWLCLGRESGNVCANLTNQCFTGITAAAYGDIGLCAQANGFCAIKTIGGATACVSLSQALCTECANDQDCAAISGAICIQSWSEVCSTATMCAQSI